MDGCVKYDMDEVNLEISSGRDEWKKIYCIGRYIDEEFKNKLT